MIIVHQQVNHNNGICYENGRLYLCLWGSNEVGDPHFLFHFLMSYDHHYTISKKEKIHRGAPTCSYVLKAKGYIFQTYFRS